MRSIAFACLLILSVLPSTAHACRAPIPLQNRIASWYSEGLLDTVAIVEVVETQTLDGPHEKIAGLARRGVVKATIYGEQLARSYQFGDELLISSCGWSNITKARAGDTVVIYLTRDPDGTRGLFMSLPIEDARKVDPRLRDYVG